MRVGLFLLSPQWPGWSHGDALTETVRLAVLADRLGFDDVWLAEHHFMSYGVCPSAVTLAGHLLGATARIEVGTAVSVLASTHPVALAEQAALLDQVSGGRFRLGVGRGGPWRELDVFGAGLPRWEHGFAEELDVLCRALSAPTVRGDGPWVPFPEVPLVPGPRTPGGPAVRVAATSTATTALAAARGLPLLVGMHADDAEKARTLRAWSDVAGTADGASGATGDRPAGHVAVGIAHVADSRAEALRTVRAELPRWLGPGLAGYVRADGRAHRPRDPDDYTDLLCRLHPVGDVDGCVERLAETVATTGLGHVALMVQTTGDPARTTATVEALAGALPRLRALSSRAAPGSG